MRTLPTLLDIALPSKKLELFALGENSEKAGSIFALFAKETEEKKPKNPNNIIVIIRFN